MNKRINLNKGSWLCSKSFSPHLLMLRGVIFSSLVFSTAGYAALSATTANTIQGTPPYLTFDNGQSKATDTNSLLIVTINDGAGGIDTYNGISSPVGTALTNPIQLKVIGEKLSDIKLYVPVSNTTLNATSKKFESTLQNLITTYNYWGDDDGDGNPSISPTTASLTAEWKDKNGTVITDPTHVFNSCYEPYSLTLTTTATATLSTQYGAPNKSMFSGGSKTYYIKSDSTPGVCGARPDMTYSRDVPPTYYFAGPSTEWHVGNPVGTYGSDGFGFLPQTSGRNFPTTGANNLFFDLMISGVDASSLTWKVNNTNNSATDKTVTVEVKTYGTSPDKEAKVKILLTGPDVTRNAVFDPTGNTASSAFGGSRTNPTKFKIEGFKSGVAVISYSFDIEKWFINRGTIIANAATQASWCANLKSGGTPNYVLSGLRDLTNSAAGPAALPTGFPTPLSPVNYYQRRIGGLFTEWGRMRAYRGTGFDNGAHWTTSPAGAHQALADADHGYYSSTGQSFFYGAVCVSRP